MRVSHSFPAISTVFDDANLVSCAGLAPTMALAHRAGLGDLVADTLTLKSEGGVNAHLKVPALVAGMVAGADCIDDMDLLRHGGMGRLFTGVRAPSTLGTFLRTFTFGHVRRNVPNVDGARTPVNNRPIPPCRRRSMSSMQSAPATIPATSAGTFRCAFTPPSDFNVRVSATRSPRPARCASAIVGANPAHETKLASSKTVEMAGKL